jgi:hypothetical protein
LLLIAAKHCPSGHQFSACLKRYAFAREPLAKQVSSGGDGRREFGTGSDRLFMIPTLKVNKPTCLTVEECPSNVSLRKQPEVLLSVLHRQMRRHQLHRVRSQLAEPDLAQLEKTLNNDSRDQQITDPQELDRLRQTYFMNC